MGMERPNSEYEQGCGDAVMMAFQGIAKSRIAEQKKLMIELIRRWPECGS
jgi:hypothetical protein